MSASCSSFLTSSSNKVKHCVETSRLNSSIRHESLSLGGKFNKMFQAPMFQCIGQCFADVSAESRTVTGFYSYLKH